MIPQSLQALKDALLASQGVPGSREATSKLATFSEAILPKDWPLAFLAAPVLEEACVPPPFAWNALKLRSPPVLTTVLRHAQHLSRDAGQSVLASWPAQALPPEVACGKVLEYLNAQASLSVYSCATPCQRRAAHGCLTLSAAVRIHARTVHAVHCLGRLLDHL